MPKDIIRLRKKMGLSREKFARIFDVTMNTVVNWERGAVPKKHHMNKLIKKYEEVMENGRTGKERK